MDGDVDEDDHRSDGSLGDTPVPSREEGRDTPPPACSSMASPLDGERFSLWSLASMVPGGAGAPPRLDLSLYSLLFLRSYFWPKTISYILGDP